MYLPFRISLGISIVITPVMGEVGTYQDDISCLKPLDMIANKLGPAPLVEIDQLHFCMIMPAVVDEGVPVFPDTEGVGRGRGDFK